MAKIFCGIDVGGTFTKMCLIDENGRLLAREKISSKNFSDKSFFAESIFDGLLNLLKVHGFSFGSVKAIGIGLPGPVDAKRGVVLSLTNIRGWNNFHLVPYLKKYFKVPVFVENDANCMALAEVRRGAARGASYALCVTLGTGVGGGLILDGHIYRGPYFLGGEVGHIPVSKNGLLCECGGKGCLERYVGNRAIALRAKKVFKKDMALEELSALAVYGNKKAQKIWEEVGQDIGVALAGVVNVFNPSTVVVGGGVAQAGDILIRSIRCSLVRHAMKQLKGKIKVVKASLGEKAGVWGAALLAKERVEVGI